ncbi:MAG: hypothetical protein KAU95_00970 [Candidatus Aenigmarchaeota archaeon]|nr:hypothetical protein [Candidatus Aenigmarchaeota archaeon]
MIKNKKLFYIILTATLLVIGIAGIVSLTKPDLTIINPEIDSFEECVKAGYPILESYPRQCQMPNGKTFTEETATEQPCAKEGEKVNRNPLMGSTDKQCCSGLIENRVSKSYSICEKKVMLCRDLCGDGVCQEIVCMAAGCPCAETAETCPKDCK